MHSQTKGVFETPWFIQLKDFIKYLSTHTPKVTYRDGRAKPLKYHIGHSILTNMGQSQPYYLGYYPDFSKTSIVG